MLIRTPTIQPATLSASQAGQIEHHKSNTNTDTMSMQGYLDALQEQQDVAQVRQRIKRNGSIKMVPWRELL